MIGFLCPTQAEYSSLSERLGDPLPGVPGPFPATSGGLEGYAVVVCRCGIGKTSAAAAAQWLLDSRDLTSLLVCGAAGSLIPELKIGDIVVGEELLPADCGIWSAEGFCFTGTMTETETGLSFLPSYPADDKLLEAACRAAQDLQRDAPEMRITVGRIVTCDQATFSLSRRRDLAEQFAAQAVEMEGAAVAHVAMLNGIPSLALRAISDEICFDPVNRQGEPAQGSGVGKTELCDLRQAMAGAAEHASQLAAGMIRYLS